MKYLSKSVLTAIAVLFILGSLDYKQNRQQKPIPQSNLPIAQQPVQPGEGKQKASPAPEDAESGHVIFENDRVTVCRLSHASDIINRLTGQTIRVNHVGAVYNICGKLAGATPLVGYAIAEGIKLVGSDQITVIGIEPAFEVLAVYPNPRTGRDRIIINKGTNTLYLYKKGELYKSYPVATGKDPLYTPEGVFKIANKIEDHGRELKPQLGERWMGLAVPFAQDNRAEKDARAPVGSKYGIHGTDDPESIGKKASGGCIRMDNGQIAELFKLVEVNTTVEIRQH
ncbi:L,D-transpeptidase [Desulfoscipio sp. XC116]|uniref:L,D-transpeptidase n=1 Tax=Desulfoscipio sp. XC116 TaxID=3144975 RepID=UPI00325C05B1